MMPHAQKTHISKWTWTCWCSQHGKLLVVLQTSELWLRVARGLGSDLAGSRVARGHRIS